MRTAAHCVTDGTKDDQGPVQALLIHVITSSIPCLHTEVSFNNISNNSRSSNSAAEFNMILNYFSFEAAYYFFPLNVAQVDFCRNCIFCWRKGCFFLSHNEPRREEHTDLSMWATAMKNNLILLRVFFFFTWMLELITRDRCRRMGSKMVW